MHKARNGIIEINGDEFEAVDDDLAEVFGGGDDAAC